MGTPGNQHQPFADPLLHGEFVQSAHLAPVYLTVGDDGRDQYGTGTGLRRRSEHLLEGHRGAEEMTAKAVFLDAAVFNIEDLANPDRMLILADRGGDNVQVAGTCPGLDLAVRQQLYLGSDRQLAAADGDIEHALDLEYAALGWMQHAG